MTNDTKKVVASVVATAATLAAGVGVWFGNVYDMNINCIETTDADEYTTVMVIGEETGDIVYVDQNDDTFEAREEFYLLDGIPDGKYNLLLGGHINGEPALKQSFWIKDEDVTKTEEPVPTEDWTIFIETEELGL